jgi:ATP-dependent metalloprotease FtsH
VAGEANATFFSASGSEFDEIYVGVGASRIRELFKQAKIFSPSIIFIDEIDTIGCSRIEENYGSRTQDTLNQLLVEMDGFEEHQNVIVIAATNMAGDMDPALLRPGRFDKEIAVPVPNKADREDILNYYLKKAFYDKNIQIDKVASATTGFTGADLSNMVNTALLLAVNSGRDACNEEDLMNARDRITLGIASPGVFRSERKKMKIALREAAHALALIEFDNMNRLDKISIIKRGQRQGKTSALPVKDHVSINRKQLFNQAKIQLATAAAEILFFGKMKVTDYNRESIHRACNILRQSFMEGIDEDFGLMFYKKFSEMSKIKQNLLEEVVKKEIDVLYNDVSLFLRDKKEIIIKLASELVKKETLTHKEVIEILNNVSNE